MSFAELTAVSPKCYLCDFITFLVGITVHTVRHGSRPCTLAVSYLLKRVYRERGESYVNQSAGTVQNCEQ